MNPISQQYSVVQMLTEAQHTNNVQFWLMEWNRLGAPIQKKIVCDSFKALLNAVIRAFTNFETIDACYLTQNISCQICIDVAHFVNKYSRYLAKLFGDQNKKKKRLFIVLCW